MPAAAILSLAKQTGKSEAEIESKYADAKKITRKNYPDVDPDSDQFYKIVFGVLKKMLGIKEGKETRAWYHAIDEAKATGKAVSKFLKTYKGDVTEIPDELVDMFGMNLRLAGRVAAAYVNKVKEKKYKSDKDFEESLGKILKGKEGSLGE